MADDIHFPTWHDVGTPPQFVQALSNLRSDYVLEQLVCEKVFHNMRRLQYVYVCGVCGHVHKAEKSTEDYAACDKCKSAAVRATQYLRAWNRQHQAGCSNADTFAKEVMSKMRENYAIYFNRDLDDFPPEDVVVFRWCDNGFMANYVSGEPAVEKSTAKALCKAALLVPYIWDCNFDWKTRKFMAKGRQLPIIPTLFEWVHRG